MLDVCSKKIDILESLVRAAIDKHSNLLGIRIENPEEGFS